MSVIIDRPRIDLKLPKGVTVSKQLNNFFDKSYKQYRIRPIKGEDLFCFAVRLQVNPKEIEADALTLEAILLDREDKIAAIQKEISLKSYQEYVSSKFNPMVQSVVQQYQTTITDEPIMAQMSEGGDFNLMRKMLIEDVQGMRKVRDALEEERRKAEEEAWEQERKNRVEQEINFLKIILQESEIFLVINNILEDFKTALEVKNFLKRWRKVAKRGRFRKLMREDAMLDFDDDLQLSLLESTIDLTDILMRRFPDKKEKLEEYQERIRETLARYQ